jgi:hypothetical protein
LNHEEGSEVPKLSTLFDKQSDRKKTNKQKNQGFALLPQDSSFSEMNYNSYVLP